MAKKVRNIRVVNMKRFVISCVIGGTILCTGGCATGYLISKNNNKNNNAIVETMTDTDLNNKKITKLGMEELNNMVEEVEKANRENGLGIRQEDLELALYISNINIATSDVASYIEGKYDGNEENMIMMYFDVISNYLNSRTKYYNNKTEKLADASVLFLDEVDKNAITYIQNSYNGLFKDLSSSKLDEEEKNEAYNKWFKGIHEYILYSGDIDGYMKESLNPGAFMMAKLMIDSQLSYLRGGAVSLDRIPYGNDNELTEIMNANGDYMLSQVYKALESKQQYGECETEKQYSR